MEKNSFIKLRNEEELWKIVNYLGSRVIVSKNTLKELFNEGYRYLVMDSYSCVELHKTLDSFMEEDDNYKEIKSKIIMGDGSEVYLLKAKKHYHNGVIEKYLLVNKYEKENYTREEILEYIVEEWCEKDTSGHNYGWESDFEWVDDLEKIKEVIEENVNSINKKIKSLNGDIEDLNNLKKTL